MKQKQRDHLPLLVLIIVVAGLFLLSHMSGPKAPEAESNELFLEYTSITEDRKEIFQKFWVIYSGDNKPNIAMSITDAVGRVCAMMSYNEMVNVLHRPKEYVTLIKVMANNTLRQTGDDGNMVTHIFVMKE